MVPPDRVDQRHRGGNDRLGHRRRIHGPSGRRLRHPRQHILVRNDTGWYDSLVPRRRGLLFDLRLGSDRAAISPLGCPPPGAAERGCASHLEPPRRRELQRRPPGQPLLPLHREPLPQRCHRWLRGRRVLPGKQRHAGADGGVPHEGAVGGGLSAASGHGHGLSRRPGVPPVRPMDRGARPRADHRGVRRRSLLPRRPGHARADGGVPAEDPPAISYLPPACAGDFDDVPCPSQFSDWIEDLSRGITGGCS